MQSVLSFDQEVSEKYFSGKVILKAVFQLRVFYTYVHARESLNPFLYYIGNEQMF